jgi:hypothetical protein
MDVRRGPARSRRLALCASHVLALALAVSTPACHGARVGPPVSPRRAGVVRYVVAGATRQVDLATGETTVVLAATYPGLRRARRETPWDVRDPVTARYVAQYEQEGDAAAGRRFALWSVAAGEDVPQPVPFDGPVAPFDAPLASAVMSPDGQRLYLCGAGGALVAARKGRTLAFAAPEALGGGVSIVHDVSPDGALAVVSGHVPFKWGDPANVVAPRQVSVFRLDGRGHLAGDATRAVYPFLEGRFVQTPSFAEASAILFEGDDDDPDAGDHLFIVLPGASSARALVPAAVAKRDFNTPCAIRGGPIVFWEAHAKRYLLRAFDPRAGETVTLSGWMPFSGYVRCR